MTAPGTRKALLASLLTAATVAVGIALAGVPNGELMTLMTFIAGYLLGPGRGAVVGGAAIALHSLFNPLGVALPPLFVAQIFSFVLIGLCGGWLGPRIGAMPRAVSLLVCGLAGATLTLIYDMLTNVGAFFTNLPSTRILSSFGVSTSLYFVNSLRVRLLPTDTR